MEEQVGEIWHKWITRRASNNYPQAGVTLASVHKRLMILFRALGGDLGLPLEAASITSYESRRSWLQRLAGSGLSASLAWKDERGIRLPPQIDVFPERQFNEDLYTWLTLMLLGDRQHQEPWLQSNQRLTQAILQQFPNLRSLYQGLVTAHLKQRYAPHSLPAAEREQELVIRQALLHPGSQTRLPQAEFLPQAVLLWLHPFPPVSQQESRLQDAKAEPGGQQQNVETERRAAERVENPESKDRGLLTIRMENIFSWGAFSNLDRSTDEDDDLKGAEDTIQDLDKLSISQGGKQAAGRLKFDLDLPAASEDDVRLHEGILLPEWDFKKQQLLPDVCRVIPMLSADAEPMSLPAELRTSAKRIRDLFQQIAPQRYWHRHQPDGCELDVDACVRYASDKRAGLSPAADGLYRDLRIGQRDLACLLLADLSLSTDTWVNNQARVIDVIKDSLFLFAETLHATGDRFAMYGFSSRRRDPIRCHQLKRFEDNYNDRVRGYINAIKPGYYTRMGAAIRYGTKLLSKQANNHKLLLIISDGKPNDLDQYEGRFGIEDTRMAIREARQAGLHPFCVTIDRKGNDYLPYLFGSNGYLVIHQPTELPKKLPLLYAQLTQN